MGRLISCSSQAKSAISPGQAMQPCRALSGIIRYRSPPNCTSSAPAYQPRVSQASAWAVTRPLAASQLGCACSELDKDLPGTCIATA